MTSGGSRKRTLGEAFGANAWLNEEAGQSRFRDERLGIRFRLVPSACGRMSGRAFRWHFRTGATRKQPTGFCPIPR